MTSVSPRLSFSEGMRAAAEMRRRRKALGLSQTALGVKLGTSKTWVAFRERGSVRMREGDAARIATALGTDLAGLTKAEIA